MDTDMALSSSMDSEIIMDLRWQYRPLRYIWPSVAAWPMDINVVSGSNAGQGPLLGLQW